MRQQRMILQSNAVVEIMSVKWMVVIVAGLDLVARMNFKQPVGLAMENVFLHNTKITSSALNKRKAHKSHRG
jgi:hypothetical protein